MRRTSGTLAFSGGVSAQPGQQIIRDAVGIAQVDINSDLTPEGWVDWFGSDADAIETCFAIFKVTRLSSKDYTTTRTVVLEGNNKKVIGRFGSAEGGGGTRIVLSGAATASDPVIRVGTLATGVGAIPASVSRRVYIEGINTFRNGVVDPAVTDRREDAVPGWLCAGLYESEIRQCFDYDSPCHFRVYGNCSVKYVGCYGVRPNAGSANGHPDFYTAFVVGGYSTSFGFIGANASVTFEHCGTAGGTGTARMGFYLFGFIGDTWITNFEDSQLEFGIYVDGSDIAGAKITTLSAHQDVRIEACVLDAHVTNCLTVRNCNEGCGIQLVNNYCALNAAGEAILIEDTDGLVLVSGGDIIANSGLSNRGIKIDTCKSICVQGTLIKDCEVGVQAISSGQLRLMPTVRRANAGGISAVDLQSVGRSFIQAIVDGPANVLTYGVVADAGVNYCEVNITEVNYGCFTTVSAARKIWYNGATWGGGGTFGTQNIATGVLT